MAGAGNTGRLPDFARELDRAGDFIKTKRIGRKAMTGSGLINFVVNIIAILAAGGIFFVSIDRVAPDAFFAKIAKIAIGALLLIALVVAIAAVFGFAGGITVSPLGV